MKVLARMLSPAMLGLLVENRYDGVLKRQQGILTHRNTTELGIGLVLPSRRPFQIWRFYDLSRPRTVCSG